MCHLRGWCLFGQLAGGNTERNQLVTQPLTPNPLLGILVIAIGARYLWLGLG
jgi:hypothetical protein